MAGGQIPNTIDGSSILPTISKNAPSPHERLFWAYADQLAVRQGKWKLILNGKLVGDKADEVHLSDLNSDPGERTNLANREPDLVKELTQAAREWQVSLKN